MGEIQYDQSGVSAGCIICVPMCSLCSFVGDIIHMLVFSDLKFGPQNVGWIQLAKPVWFIAVPWLVDTKPSVQQWI